MRMRDYEESAMSFDLTADIDPVLRVQHMRHGSTEELGEMAGLDKRLIRDGQVPDTATVIKEYGDRLWYLVGEINASGLSLEEVAITNIRKLSDRKVRGVISGKGDNR